MRALAFVVVLSMVLLSTAALAGESATRTARTDVSSLTRADGPVTKGTQANVPGLMNFTGTLTDGDGVALDTTVSMTFSIYTDSVGGTQVWTETQPAVQVSHGMFSVLLGRVNAITDMVFSGPSRWLGVQLGADPEMEPRRRIEAVGYSFRAAKADTAEYARSGGGGGANGGWVDDGTVVRLEDVNDSVCIGDTLPAAKLDVRGTLNVGEDGTGHAVNFYGNLNGSRLLWDESKMALRAGMDTDGTHWDPGNIGQYSLATGKNTKASGKYSIAVGEYTTASQNASIAMGAYTTASGFASTAMGYADSASGPYSTAMGYYTTASGEYSVAIGRCLTAEADTSIVLGSGISQFDPLVNNISNSLMVGFNDTTPTLFVGGSKHRVGIGTSTPAADLHIYGDGTLRLEGSGPNFQPRLDFYKLGVRRGAIEGYANDLYFFAGDAGGAFRFYNKDGWGGTEHMTILNDGNVGIGTMSPAAKLDVQGTLNVGQDSSGYDVNFYGGGGLYGGARFFWDEDKMALRAGRDSDGHHWAPDSVGGYSLAMGFDTKASGTASNALGYRTTASGINSTAMGNSTTASGLEATAMGDRTTASGAASTAMGRETIASGGYSTAMGLETIASGMWGAIAMGHRATANGDHSAAIGEHLTAQADYAFVLGSGMSDTDRLVNNISNSLMVAFNDTTPTLFVGGSNHRVGIGTPSPAYKLDVSGLINSQGTGLSCGIRLANPTGGRDYRVLQKDDGKFMITDETATAERLIIDSTGNVGIGKDPDAKLTIKGSGVLLKGYNQSDQVVVEIGEGLDYSETFPTSHDEITPGMVMVIDPVNKGNLTISTQEYDSKVAGIVAGAKGLGSGVRLGSSAEDEGDHAVALAGRVYCNVDTRYGEVEPGDLLTTSSTAGHAMVVNDFSKAQGAILGKAMEGLSGGGQGQILVLVTLQ